MSLKCPVHFAANYLFWLSVWCADETFNEWNKKTNKWQHDQSYLHQANQIRLKMYSHACRLWHQASIIFNVPKSGNWCNKKKRMDNSALINWIILLHLNGFLHGTRWHPDLFSLFLHVLFAVKLFVIWSVWCAMCITVSYQNSFENML